MTTATTTHCTAWSRADTPLGPVTLARSATGLAGLWFDGQKHAPPPAIDAPRRDDDALLAEAARQLSDYFAGRRRCFELPLDAAGTPFQRRVWQALGDIPCGATTSYGAIAAALGVPQARRAVGAAIGRNPIGIVVPCHRVLGGDGSMTGYAGGLERKAALLRLEQALASPSQSQPALRPREAAAHRRARHAAA